MIKILFADDEPIYIEGLIEKAKAEGCEVLICDNASEAIDLVAKGDVDCLVIDIMMDPGVNLSDVEPHKAGLKAIDTILKLNPYQSIICLSVVSDQKIINSLKRKKVLYLRKGETPLNTAWRVIESKATGVYKVR